MFTPSTCVYFKQTRVLEDPILRGQRRLASNSSQSNRVSLKFFHLLLGSSLFFIVQCTFTFSFRSEKQQWNSPYSAFILMNCVSFFTLSLSSSSLLGLRPGTVSDLRSCVTLLYSVVVEELTEGIRENTCIRLLDQIKSLDT